MKPGKLQKNKQRSVDFSWKVHDRAQSLLLCSHTLTELRSGHVSLLVSSSGTYYDLLCFVHGPARQKKRTKT